MVQERTPEAFGTPARSCTSPLQEGAPLPFSRSLSLSLSLALTHALSLSFSLSFFLSPSLSLSHSLCQFPTLTPPATARSDRFQSKREQPTRFKELFPDGRGRKMSLARGVPREQNSLKGVQDFSLMAEAGIWPWLTYSIFARQLKDGGHGPTLNTKPAPKSMSFKPWRSLLVFFTVFLSN